MLFLCVKKHRSSKIRSGPPATTTPKMGTHQQSWQEGVFASAQPFRKRRLEAPAPPDRLWERRSSKGRSDSSSRHACGHDVANQRNDAQRHRPSLGAFASCFLWLESWFAWSWLMRSRHRRWPHCPECMSRLETMKGPGSRSPSKQVSS